MAGMAADRCCRDLASARVHGENPSPWPHHLRLEADIEKFSAVLGRNQETPVRWNPGDKGSQPNISLPGAHCPDELAEVIPPVPAQGRARENFRYSAPWATPIPLAEDALEPQGSDDSGIGSTPAERLE